MSAKWGTKQGEAATGQAKLILDRNAAHGLQGSRITPLLRGDGEQAALQKRCKARTIMNKNKYTLRKNMNQLILGRKKTLKPNTDSISNQPLNIVITEVGQDESLDNF